MLGGDFLALPVHAGRALVVDLHAVHTDIALTGFGVARDDAGERDEAASVFGPALQDGEIEQREVVALDDFFARAGRNGLREELAHFGEHGEHLDFVEEALRGLDVEETADAIGDFVERVDFEGEIHAAGGAELVDEELLAGIALEVFEEERLAADTSLLISTLRNPVGDFGDFENRVGFGADAFQFAGAFERLDPVAQIVVGQMSSGNDRRLYAAETGDLICLTQPESTTETRRHREKHKKVLSVSPGLCGESALGRVT